MRKYISQCALAFFVIMLLQSCVKDTLQTTYTYFLPVYKSKAEVFQNIKSNAPQAMRQTGKLFLFGKYIFVNEINKGVHIIDNSNPRAPRNVSFISIPGNLDIAVKNNTLYADLFTDMICIDITNPANVILKKVTPQVFPERNNTGNTATDTSKYIVDWIKTETTDKSKIESDRQTGGPIWFSSSSTPNSAGGATKGIGGSMARFTIVDNYLYTVGRSQLSSFNITSSFEPLKASEKTLGWNIETIYPLKDKLFIGSQTGMFIFSIADPADPAFLGSFSHACFNDPVIADDHYAYVTLRSTENTSACWGVPAVQRNELDIVDISNILQPSLVKIYDMAEPKGLSKDGNHLFICDGKAGLKIYDAVNVSDLKLLKTITNINAFDVICLGGLAIVVADEGIYQYDYTNMSDIKLISKISVDK